ncbi:DUF6507 family protein [Streptomyces sp. NPDC012461]|jgi:hypothetical protein|uniref:DUF6507 family protein n=1 Tax=unclassified Streptomyces TaxID=2593676 RepID=UPI0033FC337B
MTGWDISPSGVQRVLARTAEAAKGLSDTGKALQETLPSAAKSAGTIQPGGAEKSGVVGPVGTALDEFFTAHRARLTYVAVRTANSLKGAATAKDAYVEGDLDMAARAHANALKEPKIDLAGAGEQQGGK